MHIFFLSEKIREDFFDVFYSDIFNNFGFKEEFVDQNLKSSTNLEIFENNIFENIDKKSVEREKEISKKVRSDLRLTFFGAFNFLFWYSHNDSSCYLYDIQMLKVYVYQTIYFYILFLIKFKAV